MWVPALVMAIEGILVWVSVPVLHGTCTLDPLINTYENCFKNVIFNGTPP